MKKFISAKLSGNIVIGLFFALILFHLLILFQILPSDIVWAGHIQESSSLLIYEGFAIFLIILFTLIIAMKIGYIRSGKFNKTISVCVWIILVYFVLNIFGNLSSGSQIEKLIFTPLTIIMTILLFRIAIDKK